MHFPILTSLIALPIAGALVLLFVPNDEHSDGTVRAVALVVSLLVFAETLLLWYHFNAASAEFQLVERHDWIPAFGISYFIGVDGISLFLVVLTGFLTPIALLSSWESVHHRTKAFAIFVLLLETAMIGVFVSLDLFLFYIFWDAMLIPMYFLIGIWGYERRVYAAVKFLLYTMAGSVLMLLAILGLAYLHSTATGSYSFDLLQLYQLPIASTTQVWFFLAFALAFAIKVPLFPVPHVAARRARRGADRRLGHPGRRAAEDGHLRAGALRVPAVPGRGAVLRALPRRARRRRHHLRRARRDGAAGHEEAGGVFERQPSGLRRPRHLRDEHAGRAGRRLPDAEPRRQHRRPLFLIVGMLSDRRHTRLISEYGGLKKVMPHLVAAFLIITLSSIGLPGLNGFVGEFLILLGAFRWDPRMAAFAATGVILSAAYMLWMFQRVNYGPGDEREELAARRSPDARVVRHRADHRAGDSDGHPAEHLPQADGAVGRSGC